MSAAPGRAMRLLVRRAWAQSALLLLVAVVTAVTAATVAVAADRTALSARAAMLRALTTTPPQDGALRLTTRVAGTEDGADRGDGVAAQLTAANEVLARHLGELPVDVTSTIRSLSLPWGPGTAGDDDADRVVLLADCGADAHVTVAGALPDCDDADAGASDTPDVVVPAALHAGTAEAAGLSVGDTVTITGDDGEPHTLEVVGTWEPLDADDPRWGGDPAIAAGAGVTADGARLLGPVLVPAAAITAASGLDLLEWTVVVDRDALQPADLAPAASAVAGLGERLADADGVTAQGLSTSGGLVETLRSIDAAQAAARGLVAAGVALVVLVGAVAVVQVARLLVALRAEETGVLRARGLDRRQSLALAVLESVAVTVPAAALGLLAVPASRLALGASSAASPVSIASGALGPLLAGAAVGLAAATVLTWAAVHQSARAVRADRSEAAASRTPTGRGSRRGPSPLTTSALVLATLAALGLLHLHTRTSAGPGPGGAGGAGGAGGVAGDPLAVAALPLAVLAVAVLTAAALRRIATVAARLAGGRPALLPVLTLRSLARDGTAPTAIALLVALAATTGVLAATVSATSADHRATSAAVTAGADLRAPLDPADPNGWTAAAEALADGDEVRAAAVVRTVAVSAAGDPARLLALPRGSVADVVAPSGTARTIAAALTSGPTSGLTSGPDPNGPDDDAPLVNAVLGEQWLTAFGAAVGDRVPVRVGAADVVLVVVGSTPVVPGLADGWSGVVDLGALEDALASAGVPDLPPGSPAEIWASTEAPTDGTAGTAGTAGTVGTSGPDALAETAVGVLRMAAVAALLLALPGLAATATSVASSRRDDVVLLRALGVRPAGQALARTLELAAPAVGAALLGALGGAVLAAVAVPGLVRASTTGVGADLPAGLAVDVSLAALTAGGLAVVIAGVALAHGRQVRSQARRL